LPYWWSLEIQGSDTLMNIVVAAIYKFVRLADYQALRLPLLELCEAHYLKGTILLAEEGINATIAGSRGGIEHFLTFLKKDPRFSDLVHKESYVEEMPFYRMKVRLKKEIVSMGLPGVDPARLTGIKVEPTDWNTLINDPNILVLDTRNHYECDIGSFKNSISPKTETFRDFPEYVKNNLKVGKHKKIAMYCTGGIRCEKASAYLLNQGFKEVHQLNGGILKYLEEIQPEENLWQGECFVFDGRVCVDEQLNEGSYEQCFACRRPLSDNDRESEYFEQGISCLHCYDGITDEKRTGLEERQRQVELAKKRNQQHIGVPLNSKQLSSKSI